MEKQKNGVKVFQLPEFKRPHVPLPEFVVVHGNVERLGNLLKGGMEPQKDEGVKEYQLPEYKRQPKILPNYVVINGVVQRVNGKFSGFQELAKQYN